MKPSLIPRSFQGILNTADSQFTALELDLSHRWHMLIIFRKEVSLGFFSSTLIRTIPFPPGEVDYSCPATFSSTSFMCIGYFPATGGNSNSFWPGSPISTEIHLKGGQGDFQRCQSGHVQWSASKLDLSTFLSSVAEVSCCAPHPSFHSKTDGSQLTAIRCFFLEHCDKKPAAWLAGKDLPPSKPSLLRFCFLL